MNLKFCQRSQGLDYTLIQGIEAPNHIKEPILASFVEGGKSGLVFAIFISVEICILEHPHSADLQALKRDTAQKSGFLYLIIVFKKKVYYSCAGSCPAMQTTHCIIYQSGFIYFFNYNTLKFQQQKKQTDTMSTMPTMKNTK